MSFAGGLPYTVDGRPKQPHTGKRLRRRESGIDTQNEGSLRHPLVPLPILLELIEARGWTWFHRGGMHRITRKARAWLSETSEFTTEHSVAEDDTP